MTADIQTLNFITHKLERLPLGDALVSENIPNLFCFHGINDVKTAYPRGYRTGFASLPIATQAGSFSEFTDWRYEDENVHNLLKRSRDQCPDTYTRPTEPNHDLGLIKSVPIKKKRSSETTPQESISLEDDEEISSLCQKEPIYDSHQNRSFRELRSRSTSLNSHEKSPFKPVARRPKSRPSVGLSEMKAKSTWCQKKATKEHELREVRLIKLPSYNNNIITDEVADDSTAVLRKDYCFRPIVRNGVFEA